MVANAARSPITLHTTLVLSLRDGDLRITSAPTGRSTR